jgi:hypothetical protein
MVVFLSGGGGGEVVVLRLVLDVQRVVDGVDLLELDDVQLAVVDVKREGVHGGHLLSAGGRALSVGL